MAYPDYISASEIAEYLYCRRAWWYRRLGASSANLDVMEAGTEGHERLGRTVRLLALLRRLGWRLLIAGAVLLAVLLVLRLLLGG